MSESIQVSASETGPVDPAATPMEQMTPSPVETAPSQPDVPDKFRNPDGSINVDQMAKSYRELEQRTTSERVPTETTPPSGSLNDADVNNILQSIHENGGLSEAQYKEYESRGMSREFMDNYVQGQEALVEKRRGEYFNLVGGADEYQSMIQWAADSLPDQDIEAYNNVMMSGDPDAIRLQIQGFHARYQQANQKPSLIQGEVGPDNASGAYESWAQVTQAMKDPRYHNDPAYRAQVEQKLSISNLS